MEPMTKVFWLLLVVLFVWPTSEAVARRHHVVIHKPSPYARPANPVAVPLVAVPPIAVAFDLIRRTSCDPAIAVSTGPGDPGFDPKGPQTGNFLLPAIYYRCGAAPKY
jgi:hypothetical protein